jgi:hypothetical protein
MESTKKSMEALLGRFNSRAYNHLGQDEVKLQAKEDHTPPSQ